MVKVKGAFVAPSRVEAGVAEHRRNRRCRGDCCTAPRTTRSASSPTCRSSTTRSLPSTSMPSCANDCRASSCPPSWCVTTSCRGPQRMKLDRQALEQHATRAVAVVAGAQVHIRVRVVVPRRGASHHRVDDVGPDDDLFEAGLDSIGALELCAVSQPTPVSVSSIRLGYWRRTPSPASTGCSDRRATSVTQRSWC